MPVVKAKQPETNTKKTLKKKVAEPEKKVVQKVAKKEEPEKKVKKESKKKETKKESKKESKSKKSETPAKKSKTKKDEDAEVVEKAEKVEKPPKKINVEPTISDEQGVNLSPAKVKNIIADLCINAEIISALKELKAARIMHDCDKDGVAGDKKKGKPADGFTLSVKDLTPETVAYFQKCHEEATEDNRHAYAQEVVKGFDSELKSRYTKEKQEAMNAFMESQKKDRLFLKSKFDLDAFNLEFNPDMYEGMEPEVQWMKLKNEELYSYLSSIGNKQKVRFNAEAKIFITAFVEHIIGQLIVNGTKNCVNNKKKIIQLQHALDTILPDFELFPFVASCNSYRKYIAPEAEIVDDAEVQEDEEPEEEDENTDEKKPVARSIQFKYYVAETCRAKRMELSANDDSVEDPLKSKYNQTSVSCVFKQFCSDVIVELLHIFGNVLKTEVMTRGVKTVNYDIISALIYNTHIIHNVPVDSTLKFIQSSYNKYNEYVATRQVERKAKKEAEADE
jgi:hypothetical protein